jgi:hypothetical protein
VSSSHRQWWWSPSDGLPTEVFLGYKVMGKLVETCKIQDFRVKDTWLGHCVGTVYAKGKHLEKWLKHLKPRFSWLILANTHVYCGEKAVQISLEFPLISSPFNLAPLAQGHFILSDRVLNPCASTTLSQPSNFELRPEQSSNREFGVAGTPASTTPASWLTQTQPLSLNELTQACTLKYSSNPVGTWLAS